MSRNGQRYAEECSARRRSRFAYLLTLYSLDEIHGKATMRAILEALLDDQPVPPDRLVDTPFQQGNYIE